MVLFLKPVRDLAQALSPREALAVGLLELSALRTHALLCTAARHARRAAEVALGLPGLDGAAEQDGALAERRPERQLVEGEALAAGLGDAGARGLLGRHMGTYEIASWRPPLFPWVVRLS